MADCSQFFSQCDKCNPAPEASKCSCVTRCGERGFKCGNCMCDWCFDSERWGGVVAASLKCGCHFDVHEYNSKATPTAGICREHFQAFLDKFWVGVL